MTDRSDKKTDLLKKNRVDLVIIGAGSGGLAAAAAAFDAGIKSILILEKENFPGGILLQCIHNGFGLHHFKEELTGPEYAERCLEEVRKRGIEIKVRSMVLKITPNREIHYSSSDEGYQIVQAQAIICATGCSERTRGAIRIPGDRPTGVMTAGLAQQYLNIDGYYVGKRVFILGSGDIGLIMARRMTLEGAKVLGVAELMPYSNGLTRNIVQCLQDFNIPLYLSHTVKSIHGEQRLEKIVVAKVDDHFNFIPGTETEFAVDTLLLSVGLIPSNPLLTALGIKMHPKTGGPTVDESLQTSFPGIFACGNSLHVHDLVDFVSAEGTAAGQAAAHYILEHNIAPFSQSDLPHDSMSSDNFISSDNSGLQNGSVCPTKQSNHSPAFIETKALVGISYVLPSIIHSCNAENFLLKFRPVKPFNDVFILIKQNGVSVKKIRKPFLIPAEMENIPLKKSDLLSDSGTLTLEVSDD